MVSKDHYIVLLVIIATDQFYEEACHLVVMLIWSSQQSSCLSLMNAG